MENNGKIAKNCYIRDNVTNRGFELVEDKTRDWYSKWDSMYEKTYYDGNDVKYHITVFKYKTITMTTPPCNVIVKVYIKSLDEYCTFEFIEPNMNDLEKWLDSLIESNIIGG